MESLYNTEIYKEVLLLANEKGYKLELFVYGNENKFSDVALGTHETDLENKIIRIGIYKEVENDIAIGVHELLHAKLFLLGYPKLKTYHNAKFSSSIEKVLLNIENSAQHNLIYPEMRRLGYSQHELNKKFLAETKENCSLIKKVNTVDAAFVLLESYLREPHMFNAEIDAIARENYKEEYALFKRMQRYLRSTENQKKMRKEMANILLLIDSYIKKDVGKDLYLRYLSSLDESYIEHQLKQKANKILFPIKFNEFPDIFLVDKDDDICIRVLNGKAVSLNNTNNILNNFTLKEVVSGEYQQRRNLW